MKVKVLHVVATGKLSGAEKVVSDICTNLNNEKFHPIAVCAGDGLKNYYENKGLESHIADISKLNLFEIHKLRKLIIEKDVKLVHAHDVKASVASAIAVRGLNVPVISHLHTNYEWLRKDGLLKKIDKHFRKKYSLSIACSKNVAEYYLNYNKDFNTEKLIYMVNKFNLNELLKFQVEDKDDFKKKLGISADKYIFGYLGRLEIEKGVELLIEGFKLFNEKYKDAVVVLVGDGSEREKLTNLIKEYNIQDKVFFMGHQKDVYNYINIYDSFVLPSKREGLPIAVLETMAMGKIIISTPTDGGIPEIIKTGKTGIILKERTASCLFESMEYVYQNPDEANKMGEAGKEFILKNYNINEYICEMEKLYNELIQKA